MRDFADGIRRTVNVNNPGSCVISRLAATLVHLPRAPRTPCPRREHRTAVADIPSRSRNADSASDTSVSPSQRISTCFGLNATDLEGKHWIFLLTNLPSFTSSRHLPLSPIPISHLCSFHSMRMVRSALTMSACPKHASSSPTISSHPIPGPSHSNPSPSTIYLLPVRGALRIVHIPKQPRVRRKQIRLRLRASMRGRRSGSSRVPVAGGLWRLRPPVLELLGLSGNLCEGLRGRVSNMAA